MHIKDSEFLNEFYNLNINKSDNFLLKYSNFKFKSFNWFELNEITNSLYFHYNNKNNSNYTIKTFKKLLINKFLINIYLQQNKNKELFRTIENNFKIIEKFKINTNNTNNINKMNLYYILEFLIENYDTFMSIYENFSLFSKQHKKKRKIKLSDKIILLQENKKELLRNKFLNKYIDTYLIILSKIKSEYNTINIFLNEIANIKKEIEIEEIIEIIGKELTEFAFLNRFLKNDNFNIFNICNLDEEYKKHIMTNCENLFNVKNKLFEEK